MRSRPASGESAERDAPRRSTLWWGLPFPVLLALIVVGALLLRIVYVLAVREHDFSGDGLSYQLAAAELRNGNWFVDPLNPTLPPSAHHPPAWTLLLAIPALLGRYSVLSFQIFASMIGAGTVAVVGLAGRRIISERGGLIAAGLAGLYPGFWMYERALLSETLLVLMVAVMTIAAYRFQADPTRLAAVALGGVCGILALVRSEQVVLVIALLVPLTLSWRGLTRRRVGSLALAGLSAGLVIAPWVIYNLGRFDETVLLSSSFGAAMAQGNCDQVYSGPLMGYYEFNCLGTSIKSGAQHGADDPYADTSLRREALRYIDDHRGRFLLVSVARQGRTWSLFRPLQTADAEADFPKSPHWVHRAGLYCYWALLPAAGAGLVVLRRRRVSLVPLLAPFAVTVVAVMVTYGQPRLRAGADVPLVLLAAVGIDYLVRLRRPLESPADPQPASAHSATMASNRSPSSGRSSLVSAV